MTETNPPKQKSKQVNVKLSPDAYSKLEAAAKEDRRPIANLIAKIIYKYLDSSIDT